MSTIYALIIAVIRTDGALVETVRDRFCALVSLKCLVKDAKCITSRTKPALARRLPLDPCKVASHHRIGKVAAFNVQTTRGHQTTFATHFYSTRHGYIWSKENTHCSHAGARMARLMQLLQP